MSKTKDKLSPFSFKGLKFEGEVVDVYDGDTIKVIFNPFPKDPNSKEWIFRLRLLGYDANEMKPRKDDPNRDNIKKLANVAKKELSDLVLNKQVSIVCDDFDVFGRILANVYELKTNLHINEQMKKHDKSLVGIQ